MKKQILFLCTVMLVLALVMTGCSSDGGVTGSHDISLLVGDWEGTSDNGDFNSFSIYPDGSFEAYVGALEPVATMGGDSEPVVFGTFIPISGDDLYLIKIPQPTEAPYNTNPTSQGVAGLVTPQATIKIVAGDLFIDCGDTDPSDTFTGTYSLAP